MAGFVIPTYDVPDVQPTDPRPAYADYGAGAGRALEGFGQTMVGATDKLSSAALTLQEQQDAVVAQQKYMAARQAAVGGLYGESGILSAEGVAAQGMTQRAGDFLNATLQDALTNTTPRQQQMIQGLWQRYSSDSIVSAAQRELLLHRQTVAQTGQAMIADAVDRAGHDPANPRAVEGAAQQAADSFETAHMGEPPEAIASGRAAASSAAYKSAILSRAQTDPMGAAGMLQTYGPKLYGQDFLETQVHLRPLVQRAQVDAFKQTLLPGASDVSADAVWPRMIRQESGGRQMDPATGAPVTSSAGAVGVAQVMPDTGQAMAAKLGLPWDEGRFRTDAGYNAQLGRAYFDDNVQRYGGNTMLAAAAYNAGPGNVDKWLKDIGDPRTGAISSADFASRIPIAETRNYVRAVGAVPAAPAGSGFAAFGDSLASGLQTAGKLPGTTQVGATPYDVLQQINAAPDDQVRGKTVLLSSGYSNNPEAIGLVDQQIAALHAKGAAQVRLVGVGSRSDLAPGNEALAAAASRGGATFLGPVNAGADGVHPSDYKALLNTAQADGPASAVQPPAPPDLQDMIARAHARAAALGGDPGLDERMTAGAQQVYSQWEAQHRVAISDLEHSLPDMHHALEAGLDVQIPELQIRSLLPPPQADRVLAGLNVSQSAGQAFKSIDLASPDQVNATIRDLSTGMGNLSQAIRVRGGALAGPGMINAADDPAGTPALAAEGVAAAPGETASQFTLRKQVLNRVVSLVATRQKALDDDPAAYVAARDPAVADRLKAVQANPSDPATQQAYETALLAEQERMGVQSPRLLSNQQVAAQVRTLTQLDPAKDSVTARLDAMATQFGDRWPQAFGELVRGKLNPQYQTLATMTEPGQEVARDDFQRALGMISEDKGGFEQLRKAAPQDTAQYIDGSNARLDAALADFRLSTAFNSGGMDLFENVRNSVRTLAYYYATRDGLDGGQAVTKAADAIIGQKYDFDDTMRVPKGMLGQVQAATGQVQAQLKPEDLQPFAGTARGLTDDNRRQITLDAAQAGKWVPNADDTGLALMGMLKNGGALPIRRADGTPLQVLFRALPHANGSWTPVPPTPIAPPS